MAEQNQSERFKAEMPQIPGVSAPGSRANFAANPAVRLVVGLLLVLIVCFVGTRLMFGRKHIEPVSAAPPPQIEVPPPAIDPASLLPHATQASPQIAAVAEVTKSWSSRDFFYVNPATGENVPGLLIRLPEASANQAKGYWAFALKAPFGNCNLEYVTDLEKLKKDYDFNAARHPMIGNPCSRTVFDPLKMANIPGNIWVRGAIVQGSDLRPPLGIEVAIQGKDVLAVGME